ncbi:MAG: biopolymer transporter ExbD [Spirulina sp. SIO3F2]|nr:biopolymer transporter ExbD [Spirulina sp. SIO3F2]
MTSTPHSPRKHRKAQPPSRPLNLWQDAARQEEVRIEIIPLIDVIFCILTFFILAAVGVSRQQAITLNLPKAASGSAQMQEVLIVSLDDFGNIYIQDNLVSNVQQLSEQAENYFMTRPNGLMMLYASQEVRYDSVVQVLDVLREAGGDRVALATLPKGQSSPDSTAPNTFDPYGDLYSPPLPGEIPGTPERDRFDPFNPNPGTQPLDPDYNRQNPLGEQGTPPLPPQTTPIPTASPSPSSTTGDLQRPPGLSPLPEAPAN